MDQARARAFFDELEKIGYGWRDIDKVLRLSKKKVLKVGKGSTLSQAGPITMPAKASRGVKHSISEALKSGAMPPQIGRRAKKLMGQIKGKILMPKGEGGSAGTVRKLKGKTSLIGREAGALSGKGKKALNSMVRGHEMDELQIGRKVLDEPFMKRFGHVSPDVILRERNRAVTLPKSVRPEIGRYQRELRAQIGEVPVFEKATRGVSGKGMDIASGQRLSRHARKRISKRMSEITAKEAGK